MKTLSIQQLLEELQLQLNYQNFDEQYIIDFCVRHFQRLITREDAFRVCRHLLATISDSYSLQENVQCALEDYLSLSK